MDKTPEQLTRSTDPDTSLAAAETVVKKLSQTKRNVLITMFLYGHPMTDAHISRNCSSAFGPRPESTYRKRRSDLVDDGLVRDTLHRAVEAGSIVALWELTPLGQLTARWLV